jgi:uncharacterized protein (DUF433 family)
MTVHWLAVHCLLADCSLVEGGGPPGCDAFRLRLDRRGSKIEGFHMRLKACSMAAVMAGHIEVTSGVCDGKPYVSGHRITVQDIAIWHERMGLDPDEIATEHGLELSEVYAALAYYDDHRAEIDASMRADEAFMAELRRRTASKMMEKLES